MLASGGDDGTVAIWTIARGELFKRFECGLPVTALAWLENERLVVDTGDWRTSQRGDIRSYDLGGDQFSAMEDSTHFIVDLVTTSAGHVIGRSSEGMLASWEGTTGKKILTMLGEQPRPLALSRDGRWLAAGDSRGVLRLWEMPSGDLVYEAPQFEERIADLAFVGAESDFVAIDTQGWLKEFSIREDNGEE